jgi:FAD/FMN-containing dehydrogenase
MLNPADDTFRTILARRLPPAALPPLAPRHIEEPRGGRPGLPGLVVAPATAEEAAFVVATCAAARVGIVPHGGGTGLVGGQLLAEGPAPVILSFARMAAIRAVDPVEQALTAEAGATVAAVQAAAAAAGRLFPLSLASEGSATIGGILATNAGGVNTLRYGNARALCLGIEAVLPDGSLWRGLTPLRKDNAGYDLRDLLIGAEGTLGVITAATLRLAPRPAAMAAAFLAVPSPAAALELLAIAEEQTGGAVSAFELIHRAGFEFLDEVGPDVRRPLDPVPEWSVLIDLGLPPGADPEAVAGDLWAAAAARGLASDGALALSEAQRRDLWALREALPEANRRIGAVSSHDIAVPLAMIPRFLAEAPAAVAPFGPLRINVFGHVGDGNLHWNVFPPKGARREDHAHLRPAIKRAVHDLVHALGGSVAAEHGIGRLKVADLARYGDPAKLAAMRAIKRALDPAQIMNPGAVLAEERDPPAV